jgi:hypothetical protein|tara:strand:- start:1006 stop:1179 length:174 start_codon:yes stop_codon:yes gene_type:complete
MNEEEKIIVDALRYYAAGLKIAYDRQFTSHHPPNKPRSERNLIKSKKCRDIIKKMES